MLGLKTSLSTIPILFASTLLYTTNAMSTVIPDDAVYESQTKSKWRDIEGEGGCEPWAPAVDGVLLGELVTQKRTCSKTQIQLVVDTYTAKSTGEVITDAKERKRRVHVEQQQTALGKHDPVVKSALSPWSAWRIESIDEASCQSDDIDADVIRLDTTFLSSNWCDASLSRLQYKVEHYYSGKVLVTNTAVNREDETRRWPIIKTQLGTADAWLNPVEVEDEWVNVGAKKCDDWSSDIEAKQASIAWGDEFVATRQCDQAQERSVKVVKTSLKGKRQILDVDKEKRIKRVSDERVFLGKKDALVSSATEAVGPWVTASIECDDESLSEWIPYGVPYSSLSKCRLTETQKVALVSRYLSGKEDISDERVQERTITVNSIDIKVGRKDVLLRENDDKRVSEWVNAQGINCTSWEPSITDIDRGVDFTQQRTCTQSQIRQHEVMDMWASGPKWRIAEVERRNVDTNDTKIAIGVKQPSVVWFNDEITLDGNNKDGFTSEPVNVKNSERYDRLKVSIEVSESPDLISVVVRSGDDSYEIPVMAKPNQTFYFTLPESSGVTSWVVNVRPAGRMENAISVNVDATLLNLAK